MPTSQHPYRVLAYYLFTPLADPHAEVKKHKEFLASLDATSRIYINEEGINGQMSAAAEDAAAYMKWMHARPEFSAVKFKVHTHHEQAFPRVTIKYRKHLVAYDAPVNLSNRGEHVSPAEWRNMLEEKEEKILIDVRNDYEWKVGRFEGAELPPCETFREFENYANELKEKVDPEKTPVMMYCTGGIRCELYSSILKERGFEKVYQLDGGVINYGLEEGSAHWQGKLFVFDDRLTVPISEEETPVIGKCRHCDAPNESYYNCANMDCNTLFLCCPACLGLLSGCCGKDCIDAPRLRPFQEHCAHKPFRKWYKYRDTMTSTPRTK